LSGIPAAFVLIIGSVPEGWNFNLSIALIIVIALYAIFRDVRALSRLAARNEQTVTAHNAERNDSWTH
jgi:ABC-type nickel/cobalt efflux system permease component RcnA